MAFLFCDMKIRSLLFAKFIVIAISEAQAHVFVGYVFVLSLLKI